MELLLPILAPYALLLLILFWPREPRPRLVAALERVVLGAGLAYALGLLALSAIQAALPSRTGAPALAQLFAPYLFAPLAALLPLLALKRARRLRWAVAAGAAVFLLRFGLPFGAGAAAAGGDLRVIHWNVYMCCSLEEQAARVRPVLLSRPADVVVLEEAHWAWLRDDREILARYPHQLHNIHADGWGIVLLSALPIRDSYVPAAPAAGEEWMRLLWARLELPGGREAVVVAAHPEPPAIDLALPAPGYDPARRDGQIAAIRAIVDPLLRSGAPVLLVGDMNTVEREPAYRDLSVGLRDAQREAGGGWGHTWRIAPGSEVPPVLRIDYMLSGPGLAPLALETDCTLRGSDHCLLRGVFAVRPPGGG